MAEIATRHEPAQLDAIGDWIGRTTEVLRRPTAEVSPRAGTA